MDRLAHIFERQAAYLQTLRPIYRENNFLLHDCDWPLPFDDRHAQEEFRLLAWRFTEEIIEAMEAYEDCDSTAYREEMADALHFLVELCLATGVSYWALCTGIDGQGPPNQDIGSRGDSLDFVYHTVKRDPIYGARWLGTIRSLSLAMMQLRQRPWRRDNRGGHRPKFVLMMQATFYSFINRCNTTGISSEDLYNAYFAKAKINDQRIEDQKYCEHGLPRGFCTAAVHKDDTPPTPWPGANPNKSNPPDGQGRQ